MKNRKVVVLLLSILVVAIIVAPLLMLPDAEFGGSDGEGTDMIDEVTDGAYEPWFEPVIERIIGRELPGETETLLFCVQAAIGTGVLAYCFGYLVARKKYGGDADDNQVNGEKAMA